MILRASIGLATAAIFSAVAAHQSTPSVLDVPTGSSHLEARAPDAFPLLVKGNRLGPPASQPSVTIERRIDENTSVLISMPASQLASL